jgi:hypothetical protein
LLRQGRDDLLATCILVILILVILSLFGGSFLLFVLLGQRLRGRPGLKIYKRSAVSIRDSNSNPSVTRAIHHTFYGTIERNLRPRWLCLAAL